MIYALFEKRLKKDFFKLSILTLITVLVWIGFTTYKALTKSQVKPDVKKLILPLTPNLDLETMEKIKQREVIPEVSWSSLSPSSIPVATTSAR